MGKHNNHEVPPPPAPSGEETAGKRERGILKPPSPDFIANQNERRHETAKIHEEEFRQKIIEHLQLDLPEKLERVKSLPELQEKNLNEAGIPDVLPQINTVAGLLGDENTGIQEIIDLQGNSPEEEKAFRVGFNEIHFRDPKFFQTAYRSLKADYSERKNDADFSGKYPTFHDYFSYKFKALIASGRYDAMALSVYGRKFRYDKSEKLTDLKAIQGKKQEALELGQRVIAFVHLNQAELSNYSNLKEDKQKAFYQKFVTDCKFDQKDQQLAEQIFNDIKGNMSDNWMAQQKYKAAEGKMMEVTEDAEKNNKPIDEKEWGKMIDEEVDKNLPAVLAEEADKNKDGAFTLEENVPRKDLNAPEDVAAAAGVRIYGYDPKTDSYTIKFPESSLTTTMKIVQKPGSKNFNDGEFIIRDPYSDAKGEIRLNRDSLRPGCNQIFLDYMLNQLGQQKQSSDDWNVPANMNMTLNDEKMVTMVERLFGKELKELSLTQSRCKAFRKFAIMLFRDEPGTSAYGNLS